MACAFICRGDLREGVPADKLYAKACKKLKYLALGFLINNYTHILTALITG